MNIRPKAVLIGVAFLLIQSSYVSADADTRSAWSKGQATAGTLDCQDCPPVVCVPPLTSGKPSLRVARYELTGAESLPSVQEAGCPLPPGGEYLDDLSQAGNETAIQSGPAADV